MPVESDRYAMETCSGIRVLLQDQTTHLFYAGQDSWTPDPGQAFDFQLSAGLPRYCELLASAETALVVHSGHSGLARENSLCPTRMSR